MGVGYAYGACKDITGCGEVNAHKLIPYECGSEPGCPTCPDGESCKGHKCVSSDLKGPSSGFIGEDANVSATEENKACINCDLIITDPLGNRISGKTDKNGNFTLPLMFNGTYQVALLKDGEVVKIIEIKSFLKGTVPGEEEGKAIITSIEQMGALGLAILALLFVVVIILIRRKGTERVEKKGK